jgi:hypothetical protein
MFSNMISAPDSAGMQAPMAAKPPAAASKHRRQLPYALHDQALLLQHDSTTMQPSYRHVRVALLAFSMFSTIMVLTSSTVLWQAAILEISSGLLVQ